MAATQLPGEDNGNGGIFAEINITPLTDIFLVLLIIFMVSSSVMLEKAVESATRSGVKVNLPKGSAQEVDPRAKSLVIAMALSGTIMVDGRTIAEADLTKMFQSAAGRDEKTQIVIQADEGVTHGRVVHVMTLAREAGLTRLAIATKNVK